jgi:hypothetical protein
MPPIPVVMSQTAPKLDDLPRAAQPKPMSPLAAPVTTPDIAAEPPKPRRRPAGPARTTAAAYDDAPTIGGLIYALNQKPSRQPYVYAAWASGAWVAIALVLAGMMLWSDLARGGGVLDLLARPTLLTALATIVLPLAVFWVVAFLMYQAEDLRLRSSAMTEVAIRLAEPDRSAEQAVASLGQSVRKQVGFMNEAIAQAVGRAGELEALVHSEVVKLDQSFAANESRIRRLLNQLAQERNELTGTSDQVHATLRAMGAEVPALIEKLNSQQLKLSRIIETAGENLIALESKLLDASGTLEGTLGARTTALQATLSDHAGMLTSVVDGAESRIVAAQTRLSGTIEGQTSHLQTVLDEYTTALNVSLGSRTEQLQTVLSDHAGMLTSVVDGAESRIVAAQTRLSGTIEGQTSHLQTVLDEYTTALNVSLGSRTEQLQTVFEQFTMAIDQTLASRNETMGAALATQLSTFDGRLLERTQAVEQALASRLISFDEAVRSSTASIDNVLTDKARAFAAAMDTHARQLADTLARQSQNLDESLIQGISAVRRTSENITRQSVKAIEGLSGQADMLKNVSENLLGQIGSITSRFENQGQSILRAANSLEQANYRIDQTLQSRHRDLSETLTRLTESSEQIGQQMMSYRSGIEGSLADAQARTRVLTEDLARGAQTHAQQALGELQRLRSETDLQATSALDTLRQQVSGVTREVTDHMGTLTSRLAQTTEELRLKATAATADFEREQARLRAEAERLPQMTRDTADQMRRALQDQMRALEQVSALAGRAAAHRDVSLPAGSVAHPPAAPQRALPQPLPEQATLTETLAAEMLRRNAEAAAAAPRSEPPQPQPGSSGWRLSDVLARAAREEATLAPVAPSAGTPAPPAAPINLDQIAMALDVPTAGAIWARLRGGQRGVLVRSIYTAEGRALFDEVQKRFSADMEFRGMVERFLTDFERVLRDAEARDPTGQALQNHLVSSSGRIYLFLAHASGRLA